MIGFIVILTTVTTVLLIKVIQLEDNQGEKVNLEVDSVDLDTYLGDKYAKDNKEVGSNWEVQTDLSYYGNEQPVLDNLGLKTNKVVNSVSSNVNFEDKYVEISKEINPNWEKWKDVRYNYGFNRNKQPVFNTVNGVLESDTMISVRGGKGRWNHRFVSGGHVFEGWSGNELSRLTLLIGKHHETFACIQTYSPAGLYEEARRFGWVKLGSDEKNKGVDFSQGWTNFYTPLTLQSRSGAPKTVTDSDLNPQLSSDKVPVGTMYYDTTLEKVRVMTADGWKSFVVE